MRATRINHVSVVANDLEESARFYEELFAMERVPTAKFREGVLWLKVGGQQLHLFEVDDNEPTDKHHFGLDVEDFEAVYAQAKERGVLDTKAWGAAFRGHPAGVGPAVPPRPRRQPRRGELARREHARPRDPRRDDAAREHGPSGRRRGRRHAVPLVASVVGPCLKGPRAPVTVASG